jgi:hypothetical protein
MSNRIIFSKEDLLKITELLQEQSLSEASRQFGLNDMKLLYERKYNEELKEAIQKGISLRPKNFKYKQAQKCKKRKELSVKENAQSTINALITEEQDALAKYRKLVRERKLQENYKQLKSQELF